MDSVPVRWLRFASCRTHIPSVAAARKPSSRGYVLKVDARHGVKGLFPASESYFLDRAGTEPLQATCWALVHLFELRLQSYPLVVYHMDGAALARCAALIDDRGAATNVVERMAARLLAAVSRPNAAECTKGRFFDRASDELSQLAKFATNELASFDLQAMASALDDEITSKQHGALRTDRG